MNRKYAVIFERAETNWAAYVPDLPGCVTTGKTLDETERNIREAISGHLETLRQFGETVPEPTSVAREIEVAPAAWLPGCRRGFRAKPSGRKIRLLPA